MKYIGSELEIFAEALNWKSYFKKKLDPFILGDVLEVGAGIGGTTKLLFKDEVSSWLAIEPDGNLLNSFRVDPELMKCKKISSKVGFVSDCISENLKFDTVLYIDVLEHIDADYTEVERVTQILKPGGNLIVLSPAHQYLFSEFDSAVGHFRRYDKGQLKKLMKSQDLIEKRLIYLDSIGWFLSCGNRFFLKKSNPTLKNILFWDRVIVPISRVIDKVILHSFGKTVVGIWTIKGK